MARRMDGCELGRADVEAFGVGRTFYGSADAMMAVRFDSILYGIFLVVGSQSHEIVVGSILPSKRVPIMDPFALPKWANNGPCVS